MRECVPIWTFWSYSVTSLFLTIPVENTVHGIIKKIYNQASVKIKRYAIFFSEKWFWARIHVVHEYLSSIFFMYARAYMTVKFTVKQKNVLKFETDKMRLTIFYTTKINQLFPTKDRFGLSIRKRCVLEHFSLEWTRSTMQLCFTRLKLPSIQQLHVVPTLIHICSRF